MKNEVLKKLATVAISLDRKGYFEESNVIDSIIEKIAKKARKPKKKVQKDFDGDGKLETSEEEWRGSRDKAIKKSINKKD